jgi:hypothetical protein
MADFRLCALLIRQRREVVHDEDNAEPANRRAATVGLTNRLAFAGKCSRRKPGCP